VTACGITSGLSSQGIDEQGFGASYRCGPHAPVLHRFAASSNSIGGIIAGS